MSRHAIVIGGGIGGLLATNALTDKFERITILERGHYPQLDGNSAPSARIGVPQSRCLHLLTATGASAFDELAPGWREKLILRGAVPFDTGSDAITLTSTGWLPRIPSGVTLYASSRSLIEKVLRENLEQLPAVQLFTGERVVGLIHNRLGNQIIGVQTIQSPHGNIREYRADLIVDSSGSTSALPRWIAKYLQQKHDEGHAQILDMHKIDTTIKPGRRYVSCWFHIEKKDAPDWHCLSIAPGLLPHIHRSAMMLRAENQYWGVVLVDSSVDPLPVDQDGFLAFIADIGGGELLEALRNARPVSPVHRLRPAINRWRHFDQLDRFPTGLVAVGDSTCTLDPYFGLGMTLAARSAVLLKNFLNGNRQISSLPGHEFQHALTQQNTQAWKLATGCNTSGQPLSQTSEGTDRSNTVNSLTHADAKIRGVEPRLFSAVETMMRNGAV